MNGTADRPAARKPRFAGLRSFGAFLLRVPRSGTSRRPRPIAVPFMAWFLAWTNAVVYLKTGNQLLWTPPNRLTSGRPRRPYRRQNKSQRKSSGCRCG